MYTPTDKILSKYADAMVNFALNSGMGIKKGEVVFLEVPETAKPLLIHLRKKVLEAGGFPITQYLPDNISREFIESASDEQLSYFPKNFLFGKVADADHTIRVISSSNPKELEGVDPKKLMLVQSSAKPYMNARRDKENKGKLTWSLCLYPTIGMAKEAGLPLKEYWQQVISACYLNESSPVAKWKTTFKQVEAVKTKLNKLSIKTVNIKSKSTDLTIGIGSKRMWLGGSGRNIPSFELFISPDNRVAEGHIFFDRPLLRYGSIIKGVYLEFKNGRVIKSGATQNEPLLKEMIKIPGADRIGEFSLTDKRFSKINKFMAETLFDENYGGKFGNTHIALGSAYRDSYTGDLSKVSESGWRQLGYNDSAVHTDIVSSEDRVVTATLTNGEKKVIYKSGEFVI